MKRPKDHEGKSSNTVEHRFTDEQLAHIKNFIEEVGGVEKARAAIEALEELGAAA